MSQTYWESLRSESLDSDALQGYKELSEKLNDYYQENFLEELSLELTESAETQCLRKSKPILTHKRNWSIPKNLENRAEAKLEKITTPNITKKNPIQTRHQRANTLIVKADYLTRKSYPNWENYSKHN